MDMLDMSYPSYPAS
ncbi:hypothetical protein CGCF415_v015721 [Colletotrichum fructicola]|nr:hypothetical protein CGCF415_v015758 [Colletotrichum fructicola]KAF4883742.1 hypothetical protein CGCF415_v015721 [Colletotrichum fructicola]KAF4916861.1 hypothetical protein CGCF245_v015751 [Colletotrichum fructicola]KAF4917499.1 hypothetical protein CGCF245_v015749 [Colletotrichum fructicola]KAF4924004.1 hypothetical protein CGCF245_v014734 [Colletotrichum fructicola]